MNTGDPCYLNIRCRCTNHRLLRSGILTLCALSLVNCRGDGPTGDSSPVPSTATLEVQVLNVLNEGIAGATVTVDVGGTAYQQVVGGGGIVTFPVLPTKEATVLAEADGFESVEITGMLESGEQSWYLTLNAHGAWAAGRASVLKTEMLDLADDGDSMTFTVDVAVIGGEDPEPLLTLSDADFRIYTIDCGWGGPRDCASDGAGNITAGSGIYETDGIARAFEILPPTGPSPYIAGVVTERSDAWSDWAIVATAIKSFFTTVGGNDAIGLATVEYEGNASVLNVLGPFTTDGAVLLDAIDHLGDPGGETPQVFEGLGFESLLDSIRWTGTAATSEFPGRDAALLVLTRPWLSVAQIDEATALAAELDVRISLIDSSVWSAPELALRTGGFVMHLQDIRHYRTAFGVMNQALSNTLPFYRMRFALTGRPGTFVPGGNARVYMHINTPAPMVNAGIYTHFDVTIPD